MATVRSGMKVGLGTGSTARHFVDLLAGRIKAEGMDIVGVPTSEATRQQAAGLEIVLSTLEQTPVLDVTVDGADEIDPALRLIKGGGAAHTREKIVAAAADRFVVMVDSTKPVPQLTWPVPLELLEFGLGATMRRLGSAVLRDVPRSPDGGVIADYHVPLDDPAAVAQYLSSMPGVIEHGLFPPTMVSDVIIARGTEVEHRRIN